MTRTRIFPTVFAALVIVAPSVNSDSSDNTFTSSPQVKRTLWGQPVQFECHVIRLESWQELIWRHINARNVDTIVATGGRIVSRSESSDSVSVVEQDSGRKNVLHIRSATVDLEGSYICAISGSSQMQTNRLTVNVAASIVSTDPEDSILEVTQGDRFQLRCIANGKPEPIITWTKQGETLTTGETLTVTSAGRGDAGRFRCSADNGAGNPVFKDFEVFVRYGPLVEIESGLIRGAFGANVTLKCLFDSYPPVSNVTWYREETFDRLEGRLYTNGASGRLVARLTITALDREKTGSYRCSGSNGLGSTSEIISVDGLPFDLRITSSTEGPYSDQYTVSWEAKSLSPLLETDIRFGLEQYADVSEDDSNITDLFPDIQRTLRIVPVAATGEDRTPTGSDPDPVYRQEAVLEDLSPRSTYRISLRSGNVFGFSNWTEDFRFSTAEEGNKAPLPTAKDTTQFKSHSTEGDQTRSSAHQGNKNSKNGALGLRCILCHIPFQFLIQLIPAAVLRVLLS